MKNKGVTELVDKLLLSKLFEGLNPIVTFKLEKLNPDSLEEAIKMACKIERALSNFNNHKKNNKIEQNEQTHLVACLISKY